MQPLVSILIPCYNAERWLAQTLECVVGQSWPNTEVIIVDDGSRDESLAVARRFESARVKVISQENQGAGAARNRALREAQGDFIQFLDADDLLSRDKIEAQVALLQQSAPKMLAVCATRYFYTDQEPGDGILQDGWPLVDTDDPLNWLIDLIGHKVSGVMVSPAAWLCPRDVVDTVRPWQTFRAPDDDAEYFARVVLASAGIRRAGTGVCYYRKYRSSGSLSSMAARPYQMGAMRNIELMGEHILARADTPADSRRARRALAKRYVERAFSAYPVYPDIARAALKRATELGGTPWRPSFGSWKGRMVSRLFGWKIARRLEGIYRRGAG